MWSALCTFGLVCGLGLLAALLPAEAGPVACDRCGRSTDERVRVVTEHPKDPLYPMSVELVCASCVTGD
jgi:hypothetical protein